MEHQLTGQKSGGMGLVWASAQGRTRSDVLPAAASRRAWRSFERRDFDRGRWQRDCAFPRPGPTRGCFLLAQPQGRTFIPKQLEAASSLGPTELGNKTLSFKSGVEPRDSVLGRSSRPDRYSEAKTGNQERIR